MRKFLTAAATLAVIFIGFGTVKAHAAAFPVCPDQNESDWQLWGYTVDQQAWANWFVALIPWGTPAEMSGVYTLKEDLIFQVDPSTAGTCTPDCATTYANDWYNHKNADCSANVHGLGEFFDAGIINPNVNDGVYALDLDLTNEEWAVFYDADRDQTNDDPAGGEHDILAGEVLCYANVNENLFAVLRDDDGMYDGFFIAAQDEGMPDLEDDVFHLGSGQHPSALINAVVASGDTGLFIKTLIALRKDGLLSGNALKDLKHCLKPAGRLWRYWWWWQ